MCRVSVLLILQSESKLQSVFRKLNNIKCFVFEDPNYQINYMDKVTEISEDQVLGISQNLRQNLQFHFHRY